MRSDCTGEKKAVLVQVNYLGQSCQRKSEDDVQTMEIDLHLMRGFDRSDIRVLTEESDGDYKHRIRSPTRSNIIKAIEWLVESAEEDDSLFFYFTGHGDQRGQNVYICPLDFQTNGDISNEELHRLLVRPLPAGCRLTAVIDCCHSGTMLDVKYNYESPQDLDNDDPTKDGKSTEADVICWSSCQPGENSYSRKSGGHMSGAFTDIDDTGGMSYHKFFKLVTNDKKIHSRQSVQHPHLSSSHRLDGDSKFIV